MGSSVIVRHYRRLASLYTDREYYQRVYKLAVPVALQNFIMSSLNMVGVIMIGQLGDTAVAAVGLANQIFFLLQLLLFGIASGSAIFTAQLWGKQDVPNIRKVLGLALSLGMLGSLVFFLIAELAPEAALGVYSKDPAVIELGSSYLQIFGWSFIFFAISLSYAVVLRSTGDVTTPLVVSFTALSFNAALSYVLIFGKLGFPALGVEGAAIAGLCARVLECFMLLGITYRKKSPAAATLGELFRFDLGFTKKVLRPVAPVVLNEMLWSLGITAYFVVYARMGTEAIAAMNIAATVDSLSLVIFIGMAHATAVLVGNLIGAGQEDEAFRYAFRSLGLAVAGAFLVGGLIIAFAGNFLDLYKVSPQVVENTQKVLVVIGLFLPLRMFNLILYIGSFRSGGDTHFALVMDGVVIWVVGVPMAYAGAFVFDLPVYLVYAMVMSEEFMKGSIGLWRFLTRRWIHNLAETVESIA